MVKPLHAGHAAQHAVEAYELAALGFTGDEDVLDGTHGFLAVFSDPARADAVAAAFDVAAPSELEESGVAIKRFACCGAIHTALDSVEALVREHDLSPDEVRRIECRVNPITPGILVHHDPRTGLEGKFSLEYSLAVMLLTGRAGLSQFTDELAADPQLRSVMERVEMKVDESLPVDLAYFPTVVTMELADGTTVSRRTDVQHGYPERPMSAEDVAAKARDCAAGILPDDALERLLASLLALESCPDIAAVTAELRRAELA
jgi:2-methylcitrate dehydratase PrpD